MGTRRPAKRPFHGPCKHSVTGGIDPVSIDILADETLLEIFTFYLIERLHYPDHKSIPSDKWRTLVHVCRRWRYIVFASPRGLNLRIVCTPMTPVREMLDIWPTLPLVISGDDLSDRVEGVDNIIASLECIDRIREVSFLDVPTSLLERLSTEMQGPLPNLTTLRLKPLDETSPTPILSDSFLGGSAPRLRTLTLDGIIILPLRNFLLSANDLVTLHLNRIPHSGYISPKAMVTCLSAMPNLKALGLGFQSPLSRPDQASRCLVPPARIALPSLTYFDFKGVSEYLEDLVAQIDLPSLDRIRITFFNQLIFHIPHLRQLISHEESLGPYKQVVIHFHHDRVAVELSTQQDLMEPLPKFTLAVSCTALEWQLSSIVQICDSALPRLFTTERLHILDDGLAHLRWQDDIENTQWLELLYPFLHVKKLHISNGAFVQRVTTSLQELAGENVGEVFPALLYSSTSMRVEPLQELIGKFIDTVRASLSTLLCPAPNCCSGLHRVQECARHIHIIHLPPNLRCTHSRCTWTGYLHDELHRHLGRQHPGIPLPEKKGFMIYDANALVNQFLNKEITWDQAVRDARSLSRERGV